MEQALSTLIFMFYDPQGRLGANTHRLLNDRLSLLIKDIAVEVEHVNSLIEQKLRDNEAFRRWASDTGYTDFFFGGDRTVEFDEFGGLGVNTDYTFKLRFVQGDEVLVLIDYTLQQIAGGKVIGHANAPILIKFHVIQRVCNATNTEIARALNAFLKMWGTQVDITRHFSVHTPRERTKDLSPVRK